ncbi:hypothetical protein CASFOL_034957 [Castilleja foliolosa]|uniref:Uncharacterized protein n=1 Tax=Castilleja foliolosa TaxID=1961234 RepID=A0ABD3BRH4_9LAMI
MIRNLEPGMCTTRHLSHSNFKCKGKTFSGSRMTGSSFDSGEKQ